MKSKVLMIVWGILLMPAAVRGEDSWLIADNHSVNSGEPLWLSFVTGEVFPLGDAANDPADVADFVDRCGDELRQVSGYARQDRGLSVRRPIVGSGIHVLGCALQRKTVEIPVDEFDGYIRRERAERALAAREQCADSRKTVCEAYTKYAKTIVEVYPVQPNDAGYRLPVGHRLEIIPLSNPCRWKEGDTAEVEVRLDGYAWPGVALSAGHEGGEEPTYVVETRTDARGIAAVRLSRPGHWFIRAHLIRDTGGIGRPEWESMWASLTFRVGGPADVSGMLRMARALRQTLDEVVRDVLARIPTASPEMAPVASASPSPDRSKRSSVRPRPNNPVRPASASPLVAR